MDIKQVEPGQGWLEDINNNFDAISQGLSKGLTSFDLVYLNGWQKDTGGQGNNWLSRIVKKPMADGTAVYTLMLSAYKDATPNESGDLLIMPSGYKLGVNYLGNVATQYGGHAGGYIQLYVVGSTIVYQFVPNNGNIDGEATKTHQIYLHTSLTWVA